MKYNSIRYLFVLIILFVYLCSSYSQDVNNTPSKKGKIKGFVFDKDSGLPLEGVTLQAFWEIHTSLAGGTQSDKAGAFTIDVNYGKFKIKAEYIGYKTFNKRKLAVTAKNPELLLDTIWLAQGYSTEEIEVEDEKPVMENQIDKKVYNLEKSIVTESGTVIDALKNIPAITVDSDNKVYLRGSGNVKIQINGMNSAILGNDPGTILDQIPSKLVESIEIINNPSSKYDPEGTSGIINIILKRKQDDGYNIGFSAMAGTKDKYNSSFNFSARKDKFTFNGSYNYRLNNMLGTGTMNRQTIFFDSVFTYNQNSDTRDKMESHFATLGVDYEASKTNILSLSSNINFRSRYSFEKSFNENLNPEGIPTLDYNRNAIRDGNNFSFDVNATHKLKFERPKEELNSSFQYSYSHDRNPYSVIQTDANLGNILLDQMDSTITNMRFLTFQSDYTRPLGDYTPTDMSNPSANTGQPRFGPGQGPGPGFGPMGGNTTTGSPGSKRLEAGVKYAFRSTTSDYSSYYFDPLSENWIYNSFTSNNFKYEDDIFSAYTNYANKIFGLGFQVGLRAEEALTKSTQLTLNQDYENNYFSIFPSIYLLKQITTTNEIQASYSRRINRPNMFQLNPFIDYSDPQNLRKGNPYLKPEYINAFELSYNKYFPTLSVTGTLFYRNVNDVINRIFQVIDSTTSLSTFDNISKSNTYGLEFILGGSIAKWWMLNGSISYSKTEVSGNSSLGVLDNTGDAWSGKLMSSFNFKKWFDLQISYFYMGKMVQAQGSMSPLQILDVAVKKDFFYKIVSLTFRVSDPFNAMKFQINSNQSNYNLYLSRKRDSRVAYLTLSIKLGTDPMKSQKRQRDPNDNNSQREDY